MPAQQQHDLEQRLPELQERIAGTLRQVRQMKKEADERVRDFAERLRAFNADHREAGRVNGAARTRSRR